MRKTSLLQRKGHGTALLAFLTTGLLSPMANGQTAHQGVDATFGTDGVQVLAGTTWNTVRSMAIQADGKILVAGAEDDGVLLARLDADGNLDATFGGTGSVVQSVSAGFDFATKVIPQADGTVIVAGATTGANDYDFMIARFKADGSLDTGFGTNGITKTDMRGGYDQIEDAIQQPDGKVILGGIAGPGGFQFVFARYNTDGSLDTSFGTDGKVVSDVPTDAGGGLRMALLPDGKFVVACDDYPVSFIDAIPTLARYNADGSLDTTFGNNGSVQGEVVNFNRISDMTVTGDGKILVTGITRGPGSGTNKLLIRRFLADGTPDATLGTNGVVTTDVLPSTVAGYFGPMLVLPGGKLLIGGVAFNEMPAPSDFVMARINADGTLDTSFGTNGYVVTEGAGEIVDLGMQADGRVVVAGNKDIDGAADSDVVLVRFDAALTGTNNDDLVSALPVAGSLRSNYPNPLSDETTIPFVVDDPGRVELLVYDLLGREVANLVDRPLQPGTYETPFSTNRLPAGVYHFQLRMDGQVVETRQMTIVR